MTIREMRAAFRESQSEFAARYHIPLRTIQNWETGIRNPPDYILELLENRVLIDLANRRTVTLPKRDPQKPDLPKRKDYVGALSWLKAVHKLLGKNVIFALDEALMCQGDYNGHSDEYIVWVYGDCSTVKYNGVVVLGTYVSPYSVREKDGLLYTDFNRTIIDALANESILDMQGITEAVSRYYFRHNESFDGISIAPEFQTAFDRLAEAAVAYYDD